VIEGGEIPLIVGKNTSGTPKVRLLPGHGRPRPAVTASSRQSRPGSFGGKTRDPRGQLGAEPRPGPQAKIDAARAWGGGLVASADGVRFTVPAKSLYFGHSPKYFGLRHKGVTWLNVVNDQVMGLGGVVVPGTLRDSTFILDAIHARDGGPGRRPSSPIRPPI
jgi:Tn3 transposase DDE domain-containing protein